MTDDNPNLDGDDQTPQGLRDAVKRANEKAAEGQAAKRELAFIKAGLDTDKPIVQFALNSYDGDLDAESVKAFAQDNGILEAVGAPAPPPAEEDPPAPPAGSSQRRGIAEGGAPPDLSGQEVDVLSTMFKRYEEERANGVSRETAAGAIIGSLMHAAYKDHDPRAIFDPRAHYEAAELAKDS